MHLVSRRTLLSAFLSVLALGVAAPSLAFPNQRASNSNIWRVRHRVERDLQQLQHDQRDYGGHRALAIEALNNAHNDLLQAEQFEHQNPITPGYHVQLNEPGVRGQGRSNGNIARVRRNVEFLIDQLGRDAADYGGHKAAAISQMQAARGHMLEAEEFARTHGY